MRYAPSCMCWCVRKALQLNERHFNVGQAGWASSFGEGKKEKKRGSKQQHSAPDWPATVRKVRSVIMICYNVHGELDGESASIRTSGESISSVCAPHIIVNGILGESSPRDVNWKFFFLLSLIVFVCYFAMLRRDVIGFVIRRLFLWQSLRSWSSLKSTCKPCALKSNLNSLRSSNQFWPRDGYEHRNVKTKQGAKWAAHIKSCNVINRHPTTYTHHVSIAQVHRRGLNGIFSFRFDWNRNFKSL